VNSLITRPSDALAGPELTSVNAIYEEAFPAHLRVPFAELATTGARDALHVAVDASTPVGFAAVRLLDSVGWVFLRYFAIAADRRGERLGRALWELLPGCLARDGWPGQICFEVEDPAHADDEPERLVREGRIDFWESCGAVRLAVPGYLMPGIAGPAALEPVLLMASGLDAARTGAADLADLVRAIYTERYGLSPEDELVRRAIDSIDIRACD
jgi:acetyltransferase (GNAT) family protein